ncbi:MAG: hypothetical protein PHP83_02875 [Clostridia bacterium]|nr:hypothetical protein [Clostridia bacterium]
MGREIFKKMLENVALKNYKDKKNYNKLNWQKIGTKICNVGIALLLGIGISLSTGAKLNNEAIDISDITEEINLPTDSTIDIAPEIIGENNQNDTTENTPPVEEEYTIETKYFNANPISLYFGSQGYDWTEMEKVVVMKAIKQLDYQLKNVTFDIYFDKDTNFSSGTDSRQNSFNQIILQRVKNLNGNIVAAYYPITSEKIEGTEINDENGTILFSDYIFKFLELEENDDKISPSFISSLGPLQYFVNASMTNKQAKSILQNRASAIIMHEICHNNALQGMNHSDNFTDLMYASSDSYNLSIGEKERFNEKTDITVEVETENILNSVVYNEILKTIENQFGKTKDYTEFKNIKDIELIDYTNGVLNITFNNNGAFDGEKLLSSINIKLDEYQSAPSSLLDIYKILKKGIEDNNISISSYTYNSTLSDSIDELKFATSDVMKDTFLYDDLSINVSKKMTNIAELKARSINLVNFEKTETYNYTINIDLTYKLTNILRGIRLNSYHSTIKIVSENELSDKEIAQKINNGEFDVLKSYTIFLADNLSLFEQAKLEATTTTELSN